MADIQTQFGTFTVDVDIESDAQRQAIIRAIEEQEAAKRAPSIRGELQQAVQQVSPALPDPLGRADAPTIRTAQPGDRPPPTATQAQSLGERPAVEDALRKLGLLLGGAGMSVPTLAGLPGEILNAVPTLGNLIAPGEPFARLPIGVPEARQAFKGIPEALGLPPPLQPETMGERFIERAGEEVGGNVLALGGIARTGQALLSRGIRPPPPGALPVSKLQTLVRPTPGIIAITQAVAQMPQGRLQALEGVIAAMQAGAGQLAAEGGATPLEQMGTSLFIGMGADNALRMLGKLGRMTLAQRKRLTTGEVAEKEVMDFISRQLNLSPDQSETNLRQAIALRESIGPDAPQPTLGQAAGSPAVIAAEFSARTQFPQINARAILQKEQQALAAANRIQSLNANIPRDADLGMQAVVDRLRNTRTQAATRANTDLSRAQQRLTRINDAMQRASEGQRQARLAALRREASIAKSRFNALESESAVMRSDVLQGKDLADPQAVFMRGSRLRKSLADLRNSFYDRFATRYGEVGDAASQAASPQPAFFERIEALRAAHIDEQAKFPTSRIRFPDNELQGFQQALAQSPDAPEIPQAPPASLDEALAQGFGAQAQAPDVSASHVSLQQLQDLRSNLLAAIRQGRGGRYYNQLLDVVNEASVDVATSSGAVGTRNDLIALNTAYKQEVGKYTTGPIADVLARGRRVRDPITGVDVRIAPTAVAKQFWAPRVDPGDARARMEQFRQVAGGDTQAVDAMVEHAIADFYTAGVIDPKTGRIKSSAWKSWLESHAEQLAVLDEMRPGTSQRLRRLANVQSEVDIFGERAQTAQSELDRSLSGKDPEEQLIHRSQAQSTRAYEAAMQEASANYDIAMKQAAFDALGATDIEASQNVRRMLSEPEPRQLRLNVQELKSRLSNHPDSETAMNGLRRIFHDAMITRAQIGQFTEAPTSTELSRRLSPGQMQSLRKRYNAAYRELWDADHLKSVDDWTNMLSVLQRNDRRPLGFGTEDPSGMSITKDLRLLLRTIQPTALVPLHRRVMRQVAMKVGIKKIEQMASLHDAAASRVLNEQLFNPDLAFWLNDLRTWRLASPELKTKAFKAYRLTLGIEDRERDAAEKAEQPRTDAQLRQVFP